MRTVLLILFGLTLSTRGAERLHLVRPAEYSGMCDASGGVVVNSNLFVAASDEDNTLRLYRSDQPGGPIKSFDLNAFLELRGKSREADLEGAARIRDRVFWIGSHGRNKDGKDRPNRCRFFATDIKIAGGEVSLTAVGRPCKTLLRDLMNDSQFDQYHLAEASTRAPKDAGALDIEGLSATPQEHLLIGFRNPIPGGKALIIPLLNPNAVIEGKTARFGPAILLDLGGLGIRDMACHDGNYLIIAGPYGGSGDFQLYRWAGNEARPERLAVEHFAEYRPEAILIYPQRGFQEFQILSDDGTRLVDGVPGKQLGDARRQTFRSFWIVP